MHLNMIPKANHNEKYEYILQNKFILTSHKIIQYKDK